MPKFSNSEKEHIRQNLLTQGEKLFVTHGIKKVTIDDLVNSVDIAKASFYKFYENKEYLYMDIVQDCQQRIFTELEALLDNNTNLTNRERVKQVFVVMTQSLAQFPILSQIDASTVEIISRKVSKERTMDYYKSNFDAAQSLYNHGVKFICDVKTASLVFQSIYRSWIGLQGESMDVQKAEIDIILNGVIDKIVID